MDQGKKGGLRLKWPWNWVVCGAFVAAAGYFIGYLWSALLAALFLWWQRKRSPDAVPQGGYCLDRTRKRLARLVWSALYLLLAAGCGVVFFMGLGEDKSAWEISDWAVEAVSGGAFLLFAGCFVYETYTDLRDALCPAKSRLARSIRSQLPYPDEAPDVTELFAMVDRDIQADGQWFDRIAIGKEWVFGDDVSYIPRIRGVFPRDEFVTRHTGHGRQTHRIIELWIVDDRRQVQSTGLRRPNELKAAVDCLRLRAPEAYFADYKGLSDFTGQSEESWQGMERYFRSRQDQRLAQKEERARASVGSNADLVLIDLQGRRTSRFDRRTVEDQLAGLEGQGAHFALEPVELIAVPGLDGADFSRLECGITDRGLALIAVLKMAGGRYRAFARPVREQEARDACVGLLERRQLPDLSDLSRWQPLPMEEDRRPASSGSRLVLSDRSGADRTYTSFTRRDLELAGEGLASGKYPVVCFFAGPRYLYLKAGGQSDGRVTVNVSRPDPDKLRVFETKCTDRQAREWLIQMSEGTFDPDLSQWKDITKRLEKERARG